MNKILPFIAIILVSCSNPAKKSIFEKLDYQELNKIIKKDTLFKKTFELVEYKKDSIIQSELEKLKWAELTYSRVHEMVQFINDTTLTFPLQKKFRLDWEKTYNPILKEVDSISEYYKAYAKENSLEQYVKVELVRIDKEYYTYSTGIRNINLGFKMTPLKGKIEQMRFGFKIESKLEEKKEKSEYFDSLSILDYSWCQMTRPFSKPTTRYWEAPYSVENILESRNINSFFRDYNIEIIIDKIRINGKNIDKDDLGIPTAITNHWRYENKEYLNDLYVSDIATELLGKTYINDFSFIGKKLDSVFSSKDKLAYEFLNLN